MVLFKESVRQKTETKPFFGFYSSSIIEAKETVPFHFVLRSVHLFHISPDCLHGHRDEADDGVRDRQVEHQVVHVGPAG